MDADNTPSTTSAVPAFWRNAVCAIVLAGIAFLIRWLLNPVLGNDHAYITFFLAAVGCSLRCHWAASAAVVLIGLILAQWFFIPPHHEINFSSSSAWSGAVSYLAASAAALGLGEKLRRQNRRLQKELVDRQRKFEELRRTAHFPEENPSPLLQVSSSGILLYANPASRALIDYWKTRVGSPMPAHLQSWIAEVFASGSVREIDETHDGRDYTFVAAPFPNLGHVNLYGRDVTAQRSMERAQARATERFHLLANAAGQLLAAADPRDVINRICQDVLKHLDCEAYLNYLVDTGRRQLRLNAAGGVADETLKQIEWLDFGSALCGLAAEQRTRIIAENISQSTDPRTRLVRLLGFQSYVCYPLVTAGKIIGTLSFGSRRRPTFQPDELDLMQRISDKVAIAMERMQTSAALRESEFRFRTLANASPALIWIADANKRCTWFNDAWLKFTGRTQEQEAGDGWVEDVHPEDRQRCVNLFEQSYESRQPFETEYRLRRADGEYRWIMDRGSPVYDQTGIFQGFIGSCVDVHEKHLQRADLERAVRERTAQLQDSVAELESFSYSIAHDMRAPLRAMHGFAKILSQETSSTLGQPHREYLRRIMVAAQRLDALIQDVLNYSRISRGDLPLENVDLNSFLNDILVSYPDFSPANAQIQIEGRLPVVKANRAALTQVMSNLLGNAVKFVRPGVFPLVRIEGSSHNGFARVEIQDNGIGIDMESQQRIFQMFQRLHPAEQYEGTGIGLAIVRKAVERMGGRVTVRSQPDAGSTFCLELKEVSAK